MEYFNQLPEEITLNILIRVPAETVLECKLVCSNWRNLVRRPSFSKIHTKHHLNHAADSESGNLGFIALTFVDKDIVNQIQYFEYNENHESIDRIRRINFNLPLDRPTYFLGSCNGLICLTQSLYEGGTIYICNPIRRECIMLPEIEGVRIHHGGVGFGYVSSTNEYKVVRNMSRLKEVYVYTLGSGLGWRKLEGFNFGTRGNSTKSIFANGNLYWLDYEWQIIVTFDLAEEKFCEHLPLPSPPDVDLHGWHNYTIQLLDGCLSLVISRGKPYLEVWLFKNKNDNHCREEREEHQSLGWSEEFKVYENELFAVTKSRGVLTYNDNHINIRNFEASTSKRIVDFKEHFSGVFPHRNSFVSLKEIGEEDTKLMESVEVAVTKRHHQRLKCTPCSRGQK